MFEGRWFISWRGAAQALEASWIYRMNPLSWKGKRSRRLVRPSTIAGGFIGSGDNTPSVISVRLLSYREVPIDASWIAIGFAGRVAPFGFRGGYDGIRLLFGEADGFPEWSQTGLAR